MKLTPWLTTITRAANSTTRASGPVGTVSDAIENIIGRAVHTKIPCTSQNIP